MPTAIATSQAGTVVGASCRGVLFIHSCSRALSPHVEWAVSAVLGREVSLDWTPQPVLPSTVRAEHTWHGGPGTGSALVSALRGFTGLRYEVTEDPSPDREGERFSVTPSLGVFRAVIGVHGDVMLSEDRIRAAMAEAAQHGASLRAVLDEMLGAPWDAELEPFRYCGDGGEVRYLHRVG